MCLIPRFEMNIFNLQKRSALVVILIFGEITGYPLKCPGTSHWQLYGKGFCNAKKPSYVCLLDEHNNKMIQLCEEQPDFQTPGYRFVIRGGYDGKPCDRNMYQPFKFWTNGSSDCIFPKSKCLDEGQIYASYGTTTADVTCDCDSSKGYAFVQAPLQNGNCQPAIEDCSCYLKPPDRNINLPPGYNCTCGEVNGMETSYFLQKNRTVNAKDEQLNTSLKRNEQGRFKALLLVLITTISVVLLLVISGQLANADKLHKIQKTDVFHAHLLDLPTNARKNGIQRDLLEILIKEKIVIVINASIDANHTSALDHDFSEMSKNHGYKIVSCRSNIDEIEKCLEENISQVLHVYITKDETVDSKMIGRWKKFVSILYQQQRVKLLLTSELPVFQTQLFQEVDSLTETIFDFKSHQMTSSEAGMKFNACLFLTEQELDSIKQYQYGNTEDILRLLCKRYAQKRVAGNVAAAEKFFKDYRKSIKEDIFEDKGIFVALLLSAFNDNCVQNDILSSEKLTTPLEDIAKILHISTPISHSHLTNSYEYLAKSYLQKSGNNYRIPSEEIRDIVLSVFGEHILPVVINLQRKENKVIIDGELLPNHM